MWKRWENDFQKKINDDRQKCFIFQCRRRHTRVRRAKTTFMMPTTMLFPAKWRHQRGEFAFAIDFSREKLEKCKSLIIFDEEIIDKIELWLPKKLFFEASVRCGRSWTEFKVNEARVRVGKTDIDYFHYFPSNSTTGHVIKSSWISKKKVTGNYDEPENKNFVTDLKVFLIFSRIFSRTQQNLSK